MSIEFACEHAFDQRQPRQPIKPGEVAPQCYSCEKTQLEVDVRPSRDLWTKHLEEVYKKDDGYYPKLLKEEYKAKIIQKYPEGLMGKIDYIRDPLQEQYKVVRDYIRDKYKDFEDKWGFLSAEKIFGRSARDEIDPDLERGMTLDSFVREYQLPYRT